MADSRALGEVRADDLAHAGVVFRDRGFLYRTTGQTLGQGGMGQVYLLERTREGDGDLSESVVGKTFHSRYLYQLRTDEVTRRDHVTTLNAMARIAGIDHPNLLPTYVAAPIADNYLMVTPLMAETLLEVVTRGGVTTRQRVDLMVQALRGLQIMHEARVLHRDFTLRNILVDSTWTGAKLFDFDLALSLDDVAGVSYKTHYQGRIFGSPGFSVPPEILDPGLMECAITQRMDVFAAGGALYGLFTDQTPYGSMEDMWGLLVAISEGVVIGGKSKIAYKETVPPVLRPVIERCLERDPAGRYGSISQIIGELEALLPALPDAPESVAASFHATTSLKVPDVRFIDKIETIHATRPDAEVSREAIEAVAHGLGRFGYDIERSLGQVKGHPIFLAVPQPALLAAGQFPDKNTFPKIVCAQDLRGVADRQRILDNWFGAFLPVLYTVRQGLMTTFYRAVFDDESGYLLLFSEFVKDARFGDALTEHSLRLDEALGLGYLAARQVSRLHAQGLAHNNVRAESLLLKKIDETRAVHPAMVGLVDPSLDPAAQQADVRGLAALMLAWIRTERVDALDARLRTTIDDLRSRLAAAAFHEGMPPPGIGGLIDLVADGLSAINFNFGVLRENGGDLDDYALLLVSHSLYGRLWAG
jgi:tRNA A-37 threonylcarbamoyl transferase component Bud32